MCMQKEGAEGRERGVQTGSLTPEDTSPNGVKIVRKEKVEHIGRRLVGTTRVMIDLVMYVRALLLQMWIN